MENYADVLESYVIVKEGFGRVIKNAGKAVWRFITEMIKRLKELISRAFRSLFKKKQAPATSKKGSIPTFSIPKADIPTFSIPKADIPTFSIPKADIPNLRAISSISGKLAHIHAMIGRSLTRGYLAPVLQKIKNSDKEDLATKQELFVDSVLSAINDVSDKYDELCDKFSGERGIPKLEDFLEEGKEDVLEKTLKSCKETIDWLEKFLANEKELEGWSTESVNFLKAILKTLTAYCHLILKMQR